MIQTPRRFSGAALVVQSGVLGEGTTFRILLAEDDEAVR